jgi:hypothetical protein
MLREIFHGTYVRSTWESEHEDSRGSTRAPGEEGDGAVGFAGPARGREGTHTH